MALCVGSCGRSSSPPQAQSASGRLYVTWNTLETDKLASIWLIKRFIDAEARFSFVPKDTLITNGIPFDTPDAEFRRYQALSCFQSILQKHAITNAALLHIGEITHDIEINYWGEKRFRESTELAAGMNLIIENAETNPLISIEQARPVLDALYETIRVRLP
jgi:hypothetical protein